MCATRSYTHRKMLDSDLLPQKKLSHSKMEKLSKHFYQSKMPTFECENTIIHFRVFYVVQSLYHKQNELATPILKKVKTTAFILVVHEIFTLLLLFRMLTAVTGWRETPPKELKTMF